MFITALNNLGNWDEFVLQDISQTYLTLNWGICSTYTKSSEIQYCPNALMNLNNWDKFYPPDISQTHLTLNWGICLRYPSEIVWKLILPICVNEFK